MLSRLIVKNNNNNVQARRLHQTVSTKRTCNTLKPEALEQFKRIFFVLHRFCRPGIRVVVRLLALD